MTHGLEPIPSRPDSLSELVYDAIRDAIVFRRLRPGERITESSLASQLQVSKTPVREALLKLEHIGLIEPFGRGMRIARPSRDAIRSAYELRAGLETQVVRLVAERGTVRAVDGIEEIARNCLAAAIVGDSDGFRSHDREFHRAAADAAANPLLARLVRDAFDLAWTLRRRDVPATDFSEECARQHLRIVEALRARDADEAECAMREHLLKIQETVLAAFDRDLPEKATDMGDRARESERAT